MVLRYLPSEFGAIYRRLEMRKRTDLQQNYTPFDYLRHKTTHATKHYIYSLSYICSFCIVFKSVGIAGAIIRSH